MCSYTTAAASKPHWSARQALSQSWNWESTILNGSIGRSGRFVLTTNEHGYRTAACFDDTAGKEVFSNTALRILYCIRRTLADCNTLGIPAFRQNGVTLESHVLFFDVSSGKQISDTALTDALGVTLTLF